MNAATVIQAAGMFAVTNIDDFVVLTLFFGRVIGDRSATVQVVIGQYVGFAGILVVSVAGALGAQLLPESTIAYLGLLPLLIGLRAAWSAWRQHRDSDDDADSTANVSVSTVAAVTFANGGDNIGVYVPVFAIAGPSGIPGYVLIFLIGVALWCVLGRAFATRPAVAAVLTRWGHIILPAVLIGIGLSILIRGGALHF